MGKFQPYAAYRDSGIEWAPKCPVGWDVVPAFAACGENRCTNSASAIDNVLSLSYGRIVRRDVETNFGLLPESFNTYQIIQPGHVVMRLTDLQNDKRSLRVGFVEEEGIITSAYLGLQFNQRFDPKFAYYLLHAYDLYKVYYGMGGGLRQTMKFSDLKWLPLFCPPRREQENVAAFLDHETAKIDRLIAKQERLIELLKEKRQAVISRAVTKGLNPDAPMKDSGVEWLGDVPAHWGIKQLRYVVKFLGGGTPSKDNTDYWDGDIPWVSPKDMKSDFIVDAQDKITEAAVLESSTKKIPVSAVLIVVRGMILLHSVPVGLTTVEVTVNQDMKAMIAGKYVHAEYLLYLLKGIKDRILELVDSSAHGTRVLPTEDLARLSLPVPTLDDQLSIVAAIKKNLVKIDTTIDRASEMVALLQEHRTALISSAVTGKIDVRGWQKPDTEPQETATAVSA